MCSERTALCHLPHSRLPVPVTVHELFESGDEEDPTVHTHVALVTLNADTEHFQTFLAMQGLPKLTSYLIVPEECLIYGPNAPETYSFDQIMETKDTFQFDGRGFIPIEISGLSAGDFCVWSVEGRLIFSKIVSIGLAQDEIPDAYEVSVFLVTTVTSANPLDEKLDDSFIFEAELKDVYPLSEFQKLQVMMKNRRWNTAKEIKLDMDAHALLPISILELSLTSIGILDVPKSQKIPTNQIKKDERKSVSTAKKPETAIRRLKKPLTNSTQSHAKPDDDSKASKKLNRPKVATRTVAPSGTPLHSQIPVPKPRDSNSSNENKTGITRMRKTSKSESPRNSNTTKPINLVGNCLALKNGTEDEKHATIKPGCLVVARIRKDVIIGEVKTTCKISGTDSNVYAGIQFEKALSWGYPTIDIRHIMDGDKGLCAKCKGGKSVFIPCDQIKNTEGSVFQVIGDNGKASTGIKKKPAT